MDENGNLGHRFWLEPHLMEAARWFAPSYALWICETLAHVDPEVVNKKGKDGGES